MECVRRVGPDKLLTGGSLVNPYISQLLPRYKGAVENAYLIKRTDGIPWRRDLWLSGMGIIDITNPGMRRWYTGKLEYLLKWLGR